MNYGKMEQLLRALVRSNMSSFQLLNQELERDKWPDAARFNRAAFYTAASRKFRDGQPIQDIIDYVADLRRRLPDEGGDLDPRAAERLIRLVVRDDDLSIDEFAPAQRVHVQQMVIYDIISSENLSDEELDAFFAEVRELLANNSPAR